MSNIYFFDGIHTQKSWALGQLLTLSHSCYIKGKELGYDNIYVEWHNNNSFLWFENGCKLGSIKCPKNNVLMINYVEEYKKLNNIDKYIDLSKPDTLYDSCPPIMTFNKSSVIPSTIYLVDYFERTKKYPYVEYIKNNIKEKYILFHYRKSEQKKQFFRNLKDSDYLKILDIIREKYKDYKIYKVGEPCIFDNKFDRVFPYFTNNIDNLFELVANCSLYVGSTSGPWSLCLMMKTPMISMIIPNKDYAQGILCGIGKIIDKDTQILPIMDSEFKIDDIKNFMENIL
jgi:hypothetical protein